MKRIALLFLFVAGAAALLQAQGSFKGTVTRMRMTECVAQHSFMAAVSGTPIQAGTTCPEYTVMSDKVVYVVVGRHTEEFMPLAENMDFLVRKNELVIFSDDEKTKSRFVIESMLLRKDWDREEARRDLALRLAEHMRYESSNPPSAMSSNAQGIQ
jgi:hypothetical protein